MTAVDYSINGFTFSTNDLIAWGTVALVVVGVLTLVANWRTIVAARRTADAALAQVQVAFPDLDLRIAPIAAGTPIAVAVVRWLGGVLPARDVDVWVRGPSFWHHARWPMLASTDQDRRLDLPSVAIAPTIAGAPTIAPGAGKAWRSVDWLAPDGKRRVYKGEIDTT